MNGDDGTEEGKTQFMINKSKTANDFLLSELFPNNGGKDRGIPHVFSALRRKRINGEGSMQEYESGSQQFGKKKRKRRMLSCVTCRKLKTKCVYEEMSSCCERCKRLRIDCSLSNQDQLTNKLDPIKQDEEETKNSTGNYSDDTIVKESKGDANDIRLNKVEDRLSTLDEKLTYLIELQTNSISQQIQLQERQIQFEEGQRDFQNQLQLHLQSQNNIPRRNSFDSHLVGVTEAFTPSIANFADLSAKIPIRKDLMAPLNLIDRIKSTLIKHKEGDESDFDKATDKFIDFYLQNEIVCLQLAKEFLEISHYFIIPGGISVIDRDYVIDHPFITCVFVLIAMMLSKEYKNSAIQHDVKTILSNIISCINLKHPLTDHDIESILYICMYDIGEFDKWILSTIGLLHYFISIDSRGIIERVATGNEFLDDDLFHLRILNALCACHFQTCIGFGRSVMIDENWWKVHTLTVAFPNATVGDAIQVAQLDLYKILSNNLQDSEYFSKYKYIESMETGEKLFKPKDLVEWRNKWDKIISKDISLISYYSYSFSYIILSRKFIEVHSYFDNEKLEIAFNTASHYSFELLKTFLNCDDNYIKGLPTFQLNQILYACITLFEYLVFMTYEDKRKTLNIISKTYWNLNKMGQALNEVTDAIAQIINKLVELATNNQVLDIKITLDKGFIGTGSVTKTSMYKNIKNSQQQQKLSPADLPMFINSTGNNASAKSSPNLSTHGSSPESVRRRDSNEKKPISVLDYEHHKVKQWPNVNLSGIRTQRPKMSVSGAENDISNQGTVNDGFAAVTSLENDSLATNKQLNIADSRIRSIRAEDARTGNGRINLGQGNPVSPSPFFMEMMENNIQTDMTQNPAQGKATNNQPSLPGFQMPDLSTFNNFDEFFKDLFTDFA